MVKQGRISSLSLERVVMLIWFLYWCLSLSFWFSATQGDGEENRPGRGLSAGTALLLALERNSMEPASQSPTHPGPFCLHYGSW